MLKLRVRVAAFMGMGVACLAGPMAVSLSASAAQATASAAPLKEIHVDQRCGILLEASDALAGTPEAELKDDRVICHLEGVFKSHHVEEALREGVMERTTVTIREQEYLLQNVTEARIAFVVEHALAEEWTIDSDPQPVKVADGKAYFRVYAEPGQIVRLHVGARHTVPVTDGE